MDELDMISEIRDDSNVNEYGEFERMLNEINSCDHVSVNEFKQLMIEWITKCNELCERAATKHELAESERLCRLRKLMAEIAGSKAQPDNKNILKAKKAREEAIKALEKEMERLSKQLFTQTVPDHSLKTYITKLHDHIVSLRNASLKDTGGCALPEYIVAQLAEEAELATLCTRDSLLEEENQVLRTTVDAIRALLHHIKRLLMEQAA